MNIRNKFLLQVLEVAIVACEETSQTTLFGADSPAHERSHNRLCNAMHAHEAISVADVYEMKRVRDKLNALLNPETIKITESNE